MKPMAAIEVLGASVPGRLSDVSLTLPAGSATALIGANGAGKSSLLHVLAGRLRPRVGHARVAGVSPRGREVASVRAYVPQRIDLPAHVTVFEVLAAAARARGLARDSVEAGVERMGLASMLGDRVSHLSGGMQQRVALAAGLLGAPSVWLLDEPASALDAEGLARLAAWVEAHVAGGGTVVTSAHRPEEVDAFAREAVLMQEGRVVSQQPVRALFQLIDADSGETLSLEEGRRVRRVAGPLLRSVLEGEAGVEA